MEACINLVFLDNFRKSSIILVFFKRKMVEKNQTSFECCPQNRRLEGFIGKTIRESVLHGVKYLVTPNLHYSERIYWIFAVAASFGYAIFLVLDLVDKYNQNPLILSFQSKETQVSQIAFPAITICNVNILKGDVIRNTVFDYRRRREEGLAKNITAGQLLDIDPEFRAMFTDILQFGQFCFQAKSFRRYMNEKIVDIKGYPDYVLQINDYIMSRDDTAYDGIYKFLDSYSDELGDLYKHATHNCQDMILKCMWEENELPCHKMFFEINTRHGRCCVFNMMPKYILGNLLENDTRKLEEESRLPNLAIEEWKQFNLSDMLLSEESTVQTSYPRRQKAGGKPFGLSLLLNPELDLYSACNTNDALGLKMVAHSPISFPSIMDMGMPIAPSSEVFVDIEPKITISNDDLSSVDIF
ncbi:Sodium channel protein Nach [Orchesella cincta]|uniref:Sodium channel protein Nach n=1 Tax=Orchesella cincta TaxID=48709 RepID=A0A1D2NJW5_ORCCI|nr:Sodium channel protein Nach [Orchesella cincta]